jgi:hypothetical protein
MRTWGTAYAIIENFVGTWWEPFISLGARCS